MSYEVKWISSREQLPPHDRPFLFNGYIYRDVVKDYEKRVNSYEAELYVGMAQLDSSKLIRKQGETIHEKKYQLNVFPTNTNPNHIFLSNIESELTYLNVHWAEIPDVPFITSEEPPKDKLFIWKGERVHDTNSNEKVVGVGKWEKQPLYYTLQEAEKKYLLHYYSLNPVNQCAYLHIEEAGFKEKGYSWIEFPFNRAFKESPK